MLGWLKQLWECLQKSAATRTTPLCGPSGESPLAPPFTDGAENYEKLKLALTFAVETRKAEIDRFWSRANIFWAFTAAAYVAYAATGVKSNFPGSEHLIISCFGLVSGVAWTMQNRGSKYWQEAWENKVEILERAYLVIRYLATGNLYEIKGYGAQAGGLSRCPRLVYV